MKNSDILLSKPISPVDYLLGSLYPDAFSKYESRASDEIYRKTVCCGFARLKKVCFYVQGKPALDISNFGNSFTLIK